MFEASDITGDTVKGRMRLGLRKIRDYFDETLTISGDLSMKRRPKMAMFSNNYGVFTVP